MRFYESRQWKELRYEVLSTRGNYCECCGMCASPKNPVHVDHIKPRSKHPELELDRSNLQVLCDLCNEGKSNRFEDDWRLNRYPKDKALLAECEKNRSEGVRQSHKESDMEIEAFKRVLDVERFYGREVE